MDSKRRWSLLLLLAASMSTAVSCDGVLERRVALSATDKGRAEDTIVATLLESSASAPVVYAPLLCTASSDGSASKMGSSDLLLDGPEVRSKPLEADRTLFVLLAMGPSVGGA